MHALETRNNNVLPPFSWGPRNLINLIAGIAGVLVWLTLRLVIPTGPGPSILSPTTFDPKLQWPTWIRLQIYAMGIMHSIPVQIGFVLLFVFLGFYQRRRPKAWMYAFLAGFLGANIAGMLLS